MISNRKVHIKMNTFFLFMFELNFNILIGKMKMKKLLKINVYTTNLQKMLRIMRQDAMTVMMNVLMMCSTDNRPINDFIF